MGNRPVEHPYPIFEVNWSDFFCKASVLEHMNQITPLTELLIVVPTMGLG